MDFTTKGRGRGAAPFPLPFFAAIRRACPVPSRSKKARVASLLPLLFFRCSGVDIRADGLAPRKARGGRLGQPPDEKAKEERLRESRRAHLPVSLWETACALPGAAPVLAIRGIAPGGWGQRPQSCVLAARWPHRDETNRSGKAA